MATTRPSSASHVIFLRWLGEETDQRGINERIPWPHQREILKDA